MSTQIERVDDLYMSSDFAAKVKHNNASLAVHRAQPKGTQALLANIRLRHVFRLMDLPEELNRICRSLVSPQQSRPGKAVCPRASCCCIADAVTTTCDLFNLIQSHVEEVLQESETIRRADSKPPTNRGLLPGALKRPTFLELPGASRNKSGNADAGAGQQPCFNTGASMSLNTSVTSTTSPSTQSLSQSPTPPWTPVLKGMTKTSPECTKVPRDAYGSQRPTDSQRPSLIRPRSPHPYIQSFLFYPLLTFPSYISNQRNQHSRTSRILPRSLFPGHGDTTISSARSLAGSATSTLTKRIAPFPKIL